MLRYRLISTAFVAATALQLAVARAEPGVPALRITAPNGAKSVLIGTLHVAAEGLRQPAAGVLDEARHFVVESVAGKGMAQPAIAPEVLSGQTPRARWASFLSAAQLDELQRRAACVESAEGYPPFSLRAVVNRSLTYASAATLSGIAIYRCAPAGLRSRDGLLAQAALARGLPPTPLETQQEVQHQREAMPEAFYVAQLYDALRPQSDAPQRRVIDALNAGDYEALGETVRATVRSPELAQTLYDTMVAQRNQLWLPRLVARLDDGDAFVAVGAYHLAGPLGLVQLLEERGYRIMPIEIHAAL